MAAGSYSAELVVERARLHHERASEFGRLAGELWGGVRLRPLSGVAGERYDAVVSECGRAMEWSEALQAEHGFGVWEEWGDEVRRDRRIAGFPPESCS